MLIPLSNAVKVKGDVAAGGTAIVSLFKWIPWPEIATFLACVYTGLRIIEWCVDRWKKPGLRIIKWCLDRWKKRRDPI